MEILKSIATVSVIAFSLKEEMSPLTPEDLQMGAEPLTQKQIQDSLDDIQNRLTILALHTLKATPEEWYSAIDTVQ